MKTMPIVALALAFLVQPLRAEQPGLKPVQDAAQAQAAVDAAVAKSPENKEQVGGVPAELAPLLMFMPYGAEYDGIDGLKLETLSDARELSKLRFSYWEKVAAVLAAEVERRMADRKDLKDPALSPDALLEEVRRMKELVGVQVSLRRARMIASDASADLKAVESIADLKDKPLLNKIGSEVLERKGQLFAALSGAEKKESAVGR